MLETGAHADDVRDRVEGAHLMEVHVGGVRAVDAAFRFREPPERGQRASADALVEAGVLEKSGDVPPGAVRTAVRYLDVAASSRKPVAGNLLCAQPDVLGSHRRDGALDDRKRHPGSEERTEQHVPAGAGRRVDPADHTPVLSSPAPAAPRALRATRAAKTPAPKPLSMFTTLTPGAQEFSIARRAASPPKEAPYPTDVGTATRGTPTSPPTTLGSAPSIPATTIRQSAASSRSRTAMIRCSPATPTSVIRSTAEPKTWTVVAASAATGASDVPAATTAT